MNMAILIMKPEERIYTFTQSQQLIHQTGCIGHLRADFGTGERFYSSWEDHYERIKTPEFKRELDIVINTLRFGPLYVDKNDCIIQEGDVLRYDDGTLERIWTLEDGSKGYSITNPDYLKNHPDAEEEFTPLIASFLQNGLRKLHDAELEGLERTESRQNYAKVGAILENRKKLRRFCDNTPKASFGNHQEWGLRVNTSDHIYLMRLNPNEGVYSLYCYCYRRDWLEQHMENARHGIRFITPEYEELFRLNDGDQVRITNPTGEQMDRIVRYVDDYHFELGGVLGSTLFHICEFAEHMDFSGSQIIPLRSSLPETCFVYVESTDEIGIVHRGEMGYIPTTIKPEIGITKRKSVEYLNSVQSISKAQAAAMSAGSIFGWDTKAADPASYNERGELQKTPK